MSGRRSGFERYLGTRDPEILAHWHAAVRAGLMAPAVQCQAIARSTGKRCTQPHLLGRRFCRHHDRGPDVAEYDARRLAELRRRIERGTGGREMLKQAERGVRRLVRRISFRLWKSDPTIEWSSVDVDDLTMARLVEILAKRGIYRDRPLPHGEPPTPRAWDILLHAARKYLRKTATAEHLQYRIARALRDDARYWAKVAAAEGSEDTAP